MRELSGLLSGMDRTRLIILASAVVVAMNLIAFALMGIDKRRARRGE